MEMTFSLSGTLRGFIFNPHKPEGLEFRPTDNNFIFRLSPIKPEQDGSGSDGILYDVSKKYDVSENIYSFFYSLSNRVYKLMEESPINLPHYSKGDKVIDECGNIKEGYGLLFHNLPAPIRDLCDQSKSEMQPQFYRFIRLLFWSQNVDIDENPFVEKPTLYYRLCDQTYCRIVPRHRNPEMVNRAPFGVVWDADEEEIIQNLWQTKLPAPLWHELLQEAITIKDSAPRAALLTVASALEAGVKQHISMLLPHSSWLMENMPSPQIHKMLRDFIPTLCSDFVKYEVKFDKLKDAFRDCQYLMEDRNKLAHTGHLPDRANVEEYILVVKDLLYILDYIRGNKWAKENLWKYRDRFEATNRRKNKWITTLTIVED